MKMLGSSGAGGNATAPGAASTIGFMTDTALPGPWDAPPCCTERNSSRSATTCPSA